MAKNAFREACWIANTKLGMSYSFPPMRTSLTRIMDKIFQHPPLSPTAKAAWRYEQRLIVASRLVDATWSTTLPTVTTKQELTNLCDRINNALLVTGYRPLRQLSSDQLPLSKDEIRKILLHKLDDDTPHQTPTLDHNKSYHSAQNDNGSQ